MIPIIIIIIVLAIGYWLAHDIGKYLQAEENITRLYDEYVSTPYPDYVPVVLPEDNFEIDVSSPSADKAKILIIGNDSEFVVSQLAARAMVEYNHNVIRDIPKDDEDLAVNILLAKEES